MMRMIRTLLIDDERMARTELRRLLAAHKEIEIVGEATNADEAAELIAKIKPDLIFLDIQMPGKSGLQLAAEIDANIQIVFCTAFDHFAAEAFGLNALDYVLKPVDPERLAKTITRIRPPIDAVSTHFLGMQDTILLKFGENARIVRLQEINRFESVANHAAVHTVFGVAYVLSSLNKIEQKLDPKYFLRASRACLVRLEAIATLFPSIGYGFTARLHDGSTIELSRRAAQALRSQMDVFG